MSPRPPRAAVWLVELFAPIESAEGVLGDLEEEFVGPLSRSRHRTARLWVLASGGPDHGRSGMGHRARRAVVDHRAGTGQLRYGPLLYGVVNGWVARLVSNLPIHDYDTSVWSWRVAALVRFVAIPLALGWPIAALARGREMVITTLVAGLLMAILFWSVAINLHNRFSQFGPYFMLVYARVVFKILQMGTTLPLGLIVGGMLCRRQQMRATRIAA